MQKKKRVSVPLILFVAAVAVVGFLLTMGNYLVALGATVVILLLVLYWQRVRKGEHHKGARTVKKGA